MLRGEGLEVLEALGILRAGVFRSGWASCVRADRFALVNVWILYRGLYQLYTYRVCLSSGGLKNGFSGELASAERALPAAWHDQGDACRGGWADCRAMSGCGPG